MVMDRNNRSHKPKGTPDGGRFETGDTGGASGDVAAPGMDPATCLTVRGFDDANRRMDGWYGRLAGLEKSGDDHDIRRIRGWSAAFDRWHRIHGDEVGAFVARRGDLISSDREAAAFMLARRDVLRKTYPEFGELDRRVDGEIRRLEREPKPSREYVDAIDAFESYSRTHADEIAAYEEKRGKELSSAREAAAYMLAKAGLLNESVRRGNMLALADEHDWGRWATGSRRGMARNSIPMRSPAVTGSIRNGSGSSWRTRTRISARKATRDRRLGRWTGATVSPPGCSATSTDGKGDWGNGSADHRKRPHDPAGDGSGHARAHGRACGQETRREGRARGRPGTQGPHRPARRPVGTRMRTGGCDVTRQTPYGNMPYGPSFQPARRPPTVGAGRARGQAVECLGAGTGMISPRPAERSNGIG